MRIAVVGSGIAGMASAYWLSRQHEVVLYEADSRVGGHTDSHVVEVDGRSLVVDTGFIVFNEAHYPLLSQLFAELGVASQPTTMSFSVHDAGSGLQYNAGSLAGLFCQPTNLFSPRFLGMLADLRRFYREAPALLDQPSSGVTLGDYLQTHHYGAAFRDQHIVPIASALWSSPSARILDFPAVHLVRFMANHNMMQVSGRPQWRVVRGGSSSYVQALQQRWSVDVRLATPVQRVQRRVRDGGVDVVSEAGSEHFDQVVLACHADDALCLLADASDAERSILGALQFQDNDTVLHTDARVLPPNRRAWAAWNAYLPATADQHCTVSYWMNALQSLPSSQPLIVSLNRTADIDPARILRRRLYRHPVQNTASVLAQTRKWQIQGVGGVYYAGAYWGHGFHEDGMRSALEVARRLGVNP